VNNNHSNNAIPVTVRIMDKEFCVSCPNDERDNLIKSAKLLDKKMREIRNSRKVIGADRIAVIAALNIAYELIETSSEEEKYGNGFNSRIKSMQEKVENALSQNKEYQNKPHENKQLEL